VFQKENISQQTLEKKDLNWHSHQADFDRLLVEHDSHLTFPLVLVMQHN
jgi:hypothetical protein